MASCNRLEVSLKRLINVMSAILISQRSCGFLFEKRRKAKVAVSSADFFLDGNQIARLESALKVKELKLQTLSCLAARNATMRTKVSRLRDSAGLCGRERRERCAPRSRRL